MVKLSGNGAVVKKGFTLCHSKHTEDGVKQVGQPEVGTRAGAQHLRFPDVGSGADQGNR